VSQKIGCRLDHDLEWCGCNVAAECLSHGTRIEHHRAASKTGRCKTEPRIVDAEPEDMSDGRAASGPHIAAAEPEGMSEGPSRTAPPTPAPPLLMRTSVSCGLCAWTCPAATSRHPLGSSLFRSASGFCDVSSSAHIPISTPPCTSSTMPRFDVEYHIVSPPMVPELAGIGVGVLPHRNLRHHEQRARRVARGVAGHLSGGTTG
jgi:hypothetical protein